MVLLTTFSDRKTPHCCRVLLYRTFMHFSQKDKLKNIPGCYLSSSMCVGFKQVLYKHCVNESVLAYLSATHLLGELFNLAHQNIVMSSH